MAAFDRGQLLSVIRQTSNDDGHDTSEAEGLQVDRQVSDFTYSNHPVLLMCACFTLSVYLLNWELCITLRRLGKPVLPRASIVSDLRIGATIQRFTMNLADSKQQLYIANYHQI